MSRDTKRIEKLLANANESRDLVRKEMVVGASLQHVYDELTSHVQQFTARLKDLQEFNAKEAAAKEAAAKEAAAKEAAAKEAAENTPPNKKSLFKQYEKATKEELLAIQSDTARVLAEDPNRADAKLHNEVITELLKKFVQ